jgi:hypothetical protein
MMLMAFGCGGKDQSSCFFTDLDSIQEAQPRTPPNNVKQLTTRTRNAISLVDMRLSL